MAQDYHSIYEKNAREYDELVAAEDRFQNLENEVRAKLANCRRVLDIGAGTGRCTRWLRGADRHVCATDAHAPMLELLSQKFPDVECATADYRTLPYPDASFDFVLAGWAYGHLTSAAPNGEVPRDRIEQLTRSIQEMLRVAKPDATLIVIETMGTGTEKPGPPRPELAEYYALLRDTFGFRESVHKTDYFFQSRARAEHCVGLFFGEKKCAQLQSEGDGASLHEWTALFHRSVA